MEINYIEGRLARYLAFGVGFILMGHFHSFMIHLLGLMSHFDLVMRHFHGFMRILPFYGKIVASRRLARYLAFGVGLILMSHFDSFMIHLLSLMSRFDHVMRHFQGFMRIYPFDGKIIASRRLARYLAFGVGLILRIG